MNRDHDHDIADLLVREQNTKRADEAGGRKSQANHVVNPDTCPGCGSTHLEWDGLDVRADCDGDQYVYQEVWCNDCSYAYEDKYKLVGYIGEGE
jgi:hypothetical protein